MAEEILQIYKNTPQPVWPAPIGLRDFQQDPPDCWCVICGTAVYHPDRIICIDCEEEWNHEKTLC